MLRTLKFVCTSSFLCSVKPSEWDSFLECLQDSNVVFEPSLLLRNFRVWGFGFMLNSKNAGSLPCEKVVWSVIQKMPWVFLNVLLHWSPPTPHMLPVKAQRFFLEMVHGVSSETVYACCWAFCGSVSTTWLRTHIHQVISQEVLSYQRRK